jgi:hypothetical protein
MDWYVAPLIGAIAFGAMMLIAIIRAGIISGQ